MKDKNSFPIATAKIMDALNWVGLKYDEGIIATPLQSNMNTLSQNGQTCTEIMLKSFLRCFCTKERLSNLREDSAEAGKPGGGYDRRCRYLSTSEIRGNIAEGKPYSIRMKIPEGKTTITDGVHGKATFSNRTLDDGILFKTDGHATYHLANVVDDNAMGVSHVLRGEFFHLPLLFNKDGTKLSKRQSDLSLDYFKDQEFLPSAVLTFAASMGLALPASASKSLFTLDELVEEFDVERLQKAPAVVSYDRLLHLNKLGLNEWIDRDYASFTKKYQSLVKSKHPTSDKLSDEPYILQMVHSIKDRARTFPELVSLSSPFLASPDYSSTEAKVWRASLNSSDIQMTLETALEMLSKIDEAAWRTEIPNVLKSDFLVGPSSKPRSVVLRYAVAGVKTGPKLPDMISILGKNTVIKRIQHVLDMEKVN
ncbi:hypothetical protein BC829DRAFT_419847 [Chytridium lagenaria]|nr:hypothetical protein BC829DRAFT_419847 [Chytridium lagenaria]